MQQQQHAKHFSLCRAVAHSDCCFFCAVYKYSYLLTFSQRTISFFLLFCSMAEFVCMVCCMKRVSSQFLNAVKLSAYHIILQVLQSLWFSATTAILLQMVLIGTRWLWGSWSAVVRIHWRLIGEAPSVQIYKTWTLTCSETILQRPHATRTVSQAGKHSMCQ